ncbi:MFS transporter [Arcanobacterium phocae]|uniref:MFS transporter n=1 Tax=Arcanobacterium phocae TaxID=131112 RepID=UPI001C0E9225|nr:MFS transporter [Arcanobacterium phocae]
MGKYSIKGLMYPSSINLWYLACAQGISSFASAFLTFSLVLYGANSSDTFGLGLSLAARTLPILLVTLLGGVIADKWDRVKVSVSSIVAGMILNVCLALVLPGEGLGWKAQLILLLSGFVVAIGSPSLYALLPSIVEKSEILHGNALVRSFRNVAGIVAPGAAAAIGVHTSPVFLLWSIVAMNAVSACLVARIKITENVIAQKDEGNDRTTFRSVMSGNSWLYFTIPFWGIFLAVHSGAAEVSQPIYIIERLGPSIWSLMMSSVAIGYVCGSLFSLRIRTTKLISGSMAWGALSVAQLLACSLSDSFWILIISSFLTGVGFEISGVLWGSALQSRIPASQMGRVSSLDYMISFGTTPFAYFIYALFPAQILHSVISISALLLIILALGGISMGLFLDRKNSRISASESSAEPSSSVIG